MKHRIVVLGAGYAGAITAGRLAKRLHRADVEITLVNAEPDFVERIRLHQHLAGTGTATRPLTKILHPSVRLRVAAVESIGARSVVEKPNRLSCNSVGEGAFRSSG